MPLTSGTRLGPYEILAPIGAGGMGEVYRAHDTRLGRHIAIKVLPADVTSQPDRLARFEREARTVASLNHPNIVTLHSIEENDGVRFLTMELVEGQSLDRHVAPGGLAVTRLLEIGIAISDALTAAHEKGVVHRDLKPANVMLTREGRVKVLDFGLAKRGQNHAALGGSLAATAPISAVGEILGTVPYMAPEQIRGELVDARTDLFALGILLYELAVGRRPFHGANAADLTSAILRDAPEPLRHARADLPEDFERIVARCLEKDPRERMQTALDISNDLRRLRRALERGAGAPTRTLPEKVASIAVLPFVNRSQSVEDEYFSDGLADELLNTLAKIRGLRVAARTSSFHFKGKDTTIALVGKALNVATVLEGSVRKAGSRVRIAVNLVNVANGYHLWSETYDRTLEDIFAVQDDITRSVVKELRATLLGEEADSDASHEARADVAKAAKGRGADPEAHRLHLLARYLINRHTRENVAKAIEYLKEALARDPGFALAWVALATAYSEEADRAWVPAAEGNERSRMALERALELEPDLAEAYAVLGWLQMVHDWDWRGAEASLARALKLAPGDARVLVQAGSLAGFTGRLDEAIELYGRGLEQDPLRTGAYHNLGMVLDAASRFSEAEATFRRALDLAPHRPGIRAYLAITVLAQGRSDEAIAEAQGESDDTYRLWALAIIHHSRGRSSESDAALGELIERCAGDSAYQIAEVHGARGEVNEAFAWLDRAYAQRDGGLAMVKINRLLGGLHHDPRWSAWMKKMGFEE